MKGRVKVTKVILQYIYGYRQDGQVLTHDSNLPIGPVELVAMAILEELTHTCAIMICEEKGHDIVEEVEGWGSTYCKRCKIVMA